MKSSALADLQAGVRCARHAGGRLEKARWIWLVKPTLEQALVAVGLQVERSHRVLAVDDEPENLAVVEAVLEDDCEVLSAERAAVALELLEGGQPVDAIIADQRMPGMTGVQLLARVAERFPETIRIVLTAYTDVEPMIDAVNRGDVYRFLIKPFDPGELRAVVADACQLKWTRAALQRVISALGEQNATLYQTHLRLAELQDKLSEQARLATLGRLAAGTAHDVRNCIAIVSLLVEYVQSKGCGDASVLAMARQMVDGTKPLLDFLDQVRRLAAARSSKQSVCPRTFVAEVAEEFCKEGGRSDTGVLLEVAEDAPSLHVDVEAMKQTLLSLLRASPPTGETLAVTVRTPRSEEVCFEVRGAGEQQQLQLKLARLTAEAQGARLVPAADPAEGTVARVYMDNRPAQGQSRC